MARGEAEKLELLGCLLGLPEWTKTLTAKCEFPSNRITELPCDDMIGESIMSTDLTEVRFVLSSSCQ